MENYRAKYLIGTTKFSAGIFLSELIARKKCYYEHLKFLAFDTYDKAEKYFFENYGHFIAYEDFQVNRLYQVQKKNIYSVFFSEFYVGITFSECFELSFSVLTANYNVLSERIHYLEYEDAQTLAKDRFAIKYGNKDFYIYGNIPINRIITFDDMLRRNKLLQGGD